MLMMSCCTVPCVWSSWDAWSPCSHTCGTGEKTRMRTVLQEAQYDGEPCEGLGVETMQCEDEPCSNCTEPLVVVERCNCPRICLHVAQPESCSEPVVCEGT